MESPMLLAERCDRVCGAVGKGRGATTNRAGQPDLQPAVFKGRQQIADCKFAIEEDMRFADPCTQCCTMKRTKTLKFLFCLLLLCQLYTKCVVDAKDTGVKKYGSKHVPEVPDWLQQMLRDREKVRKKREKGDGAEAPKESNDGVPASVLCPRLFVQPIPPGLPVENYSVLDLDLDLPELRVNFESVIAHHRFWTWANSEVMYRWFDSEHHQSWVCPPSGTYLNYIRYKGRMMCLVGDGAQSWFTGILTENFAAEFQHDLQTHKPNSKKKSKIGREDGQVQYIHTAPNVTRISLPGKGNYKNPLRTFLGPKNLRTSFDIVWSFLHGKAGGDICDALDVFIIHIWDSARNDLIKEKTMSSFSEDAKDMRLETEHVNMMNNWATMSDRAIKSIEALGNFNEKLGIPMSSTWDALRIMRILHRPVAEPRGSFDMKDLPIPLEDGGRPLSTSIVFPKWIIESYPNIEAKVSTKLKLSDDETETSSYSEVKTNISEQKENIDSGPGKSYGNISSSKIITKYKDAGRRIINDDLKLVVSYCKPDAIIRDICQMADSLITKPTRESKDIIDALQKVTVACDYKIVEDNLRHQLKECSSDSENFCLSVANAYSKVEDAEFEENEAYAVDIVTSTRLEKRTLLTTALHGKQNTIFHEKPGDPVAHIKHSSNSVDESIEIKGRCEKKGASGSEDPKWNIVDIEGDGRCLFRALVHGYHFHEYKKKMNDEVETEEADKLRLEVAAEMEGRRRAQLLGLSLGILVLT